MDGGGDSLVGGAGVERQDFFPGTGFGDGGEGEGAVREMLAEEGADECHIIGWDGWTFGGFFRSLWLRRTGGC